MTRGARATLSLALGIGVLAMHCLVLLMASSAPMTMTRSAPVAGVSSVRSSAPAASPASLHMSMTGCGSHHCVAARGAFPTEPIATPTEVGGVAVAAATPARSTTCPASTRSARPPPRSGSCSPLCVWRV